MREQGTMVDKCQLESSLARSGAIQAHQTRYRDMYVPYRVELNLLSSDFHTRARTALYRQI